MEIKQVEDILAQISRYLMLQVNTISNIGLMNGKMGIAIFFYYYSRYTGNILYRDFAGELIDDIYADANTETSFDFENGFCGIGWSILHLVEEKFVDADVDEVLNEMDQYIIEKDIRRINDCTLRRGIAGIAHYAIRRRNMDRIYLEELLQNMDSHGYIDEEFEFLKKSLREIICQKKVTTSYSTKRLLRMLVKPIPENLINLSYIDFPNIDINGLSGIGLNLMLNEYGKN